MKQHSTLDELVKTITGLIPADITQLQDDVESSIRSALQSGLAKMDLVTREEFDIQVALLQRSREKLDRLEQKLETLTKDLKSDH